MWNEMIPGIFLAYQSICDIRKRTINAFACMLFSIAGLVLMSIRRPENLLSVVIGILTGVCLVVLSHLTKEGIGKGDGYVVAAVGGWIGGAKALAVLMIALFLATAFGMIQIAAGKADGKTRLAFVPFLTCSYILLIMGKV